MQNAVDTVYRNMVECQRLSGLEAELFSLFVVNDDVVKRIRLKTGALDDCVWDGEVATQGFDC